MRGHLLGLTVFIFQISGLAYAGDTFDCYKALDQFNNRKHLSRDESFGVIYGTDYNFTLISEAGLKSCKLPEKPYSIHHGGPPFLLNVQLDGVDHSLSYEREGIKEVDGEPEHSKVTCTADNGKAATKIWRSAIETEIGEARNICNSVRESNADGLLPQDKCLSKLDSALAVCEKIPDAEFKHYVSGIRRTTAAELQRIPATNSN